MLNQFSRTEILLGKSAMERLSKSRVAVFGIGGVGGYVCEALARSGVGALDLIDEEYLNEKAVFPDKKTIESCESLVSLDPETTELYSDYWKKIKAE